MDKGELIIAVSNSFSKDKALNLIGDLDLSGVKLEGYNFLLLVEKLGNDLLLALQKAHFDFK